MDGLETPSASHETAEIRFRRRPAKDDDFQRIEVLSTYSGTPRAPPASRLGLAFVPVGPPLLHAAAHFRELGIAPESPRLLFPPHRRLALTGQAPRDGSIGTYQRAFAPVPTLSRGGNARPQRPKRLLRSNQLASRCAANFMKVLLPSSTEVRNRKNLTD